MNTNASEFHGKLLESYLLFEPIFIPNKQKICCKNFIIFLFLGEDVYHGKKWNNLVKD